MDLIVTADGGQAAGHARWAASRFACALGRSGISQAKREGDGATPVGTFAFRRVLYRADRLASLSTALAARALAPSDGWCDAPGDPQYNRLVARPCGASHEALWREDEIYDVILVVGHNDDPVVPGAGSAIFIHVARGDYAPTEGCVALALGDLLAVLAQADGRSRLIVHGPRL